MKGIEEGSRELIVSGCDGAVDFEMADHALDPIAFPVDASVPADFSGSRAFGRNAATHTGRFQGLPDRVGVVALIGDEVAGLLFGERRHFFERRAVVRFPGCEMEAERETSGITETMNLTGEPAARAAKSLFTSPPFAPAAET